MAVTPQTNVTLEQIADVILENDVFCVGGHVNPDGDCIGSTLGLVNALRSIGKTAYAIVADDDPVDQNLSFMLGFDELIPASKFDEDFNVYIMVDAPSDNRIGESAAALRAKAPLTITIDHHAVPERASDLSYTDPDSASTTMLIWQLCHFLGIDFSEAIDIAACCYAGLVTDTGRFMFQNTDKACFDMASEMVACGALPSDIGRFLFQEKPLASVELDSLAIKHMKIIADGRVAVSWISISDMKSLDASDSDAENTINVIRSIKGVDVVCMLKERDGRIRGSLRSKDDTDVSEIAREFGGGGHKAAAGFNLYCTLDEAIEIVERRLMEMCS